MNLPERGHWLDKQLIIKVRRADVRAAQSRPLHTCPDPLQIHQLRQRYQEEIKASVLTDTAQVKDGNTVAHDFGAVRDDKVER